MFINASAEYSSAEDPGHKVCAEHKHLVRGYIRQLAEKAGARDPEDLAARLHLLLEGAIVEAHVSGNRNAADLARSIAAMVVERAFA